MSETPVRNVIIIGSGPAGLTASIYAARANMKPLLIEGFSAGGLIPGGQLMFTTEVENYPGFPEKVTGQELMQRFRDQAERQGTEIVTADVSKVDLSQRPFKVWVEETLYLAQTVIIATGARANYLGLPSEDALKNKGVSACAVCDGALFRGQPVVVVGGGDTAMEEANYLAKMCSSVTVVHRRDSLRASKIMQDRALSNPKIKFIWDSAIEEIVGDQKGVSGAIVKNLKTGDSKKVEAKGLFVAIGHVPTTELFKDQLKLQANGYLWVQPGTAKTSIEGVFASGDVSDSTYRQAVTAAGTGCMAAIEAERWMTEHGVG